MISIIDLDDCAIALGRKCGNQGEPVVIDGAGKPVSFMSAKQRALFDWMKSAGEVVPCTGRTISGLAKVRLPFTGYAICNFGATILTPSGDLEPRWQATIDMLAPACEAQILEFQRCAHQQFGETIKSTVVRDGGNPLLLSIKHRDKDNDQLALLHAQMHPLLPSGWRIHRNDNVVAVLPPFVGKEFAVAWYLEHIAEPGSLVIGLGDSFTDAAFMGLCHFAITPTESQLFSLFGFGK